MYKVNNSAALTALTHLFITVRSSFVQTFFVWLTVYLECVPNWKDFFHHYRDHINIRSRITLPRKMLTFNIQNHFSFKIQ